MDIEKVKRHIRVIDDFEDETIAMYIEWSEAKIKGAVTDDPVVYGLFFDNNQNYERAVVLLTSHYFNNRLPMVDKPQYNLAFGLRDALSHMRADFIRYKKEMDMDINESTY